MRSLLITLVLEEVPSKSNDERLQLVIRELVSVLARGTGFPVLVTRLSTRARDAIAR